MRTLTVRERPLGKMARSLRKRSSEASSVPALTPPVSDASSTCVRALKAHASDACVLSLSSTERRQRAAHVCRRNVRGQRAHLVSSIDDTEGTGAPSRRTDSPVFTRLAPSKTPACQQAPAGATFSGEPSKAGHVSAKCAHTVTDGKTALLATLLR